MPVHRRTSYTRRDGTHVAAATIHTTHNPAADVPTATRESLRGQASAAATGAVDRPTKEPEPTPYHRRFRSFDRRTTATTRTMFKTPLYRQTPERQIEIMQGWVDDVSRVYDMEPPRVSIDERTASYGGCYLPDTNEIRVPKASRMTLMHEFRHAMQHQTTVGMVEPTHGDVRHEEDARAWSMSLFHSVAPKLFRRSSLEGKIFHVEPSTLAEFAERDQR